MFGYFIFSLIFNWYLFIKLLFFFIFWEGLDECFSIINYLVKIEGVNVWIIYVILESKVVFGGCFIKLCID